MVTCLHGLPSRTLDLVVGWYARRVKFSTICPIVEYSAGEAYKPKAGHVILSRLGLKFNNRTQIFHLRKEN